MVIVFFFEHETAYEMRISDWSSAVCSSDLRTGRSADQRLQYRKSGAISAGAKTDFTSAKTPHLRSFAVSPAAPSARKADRKSVVTGKGGSVRVDLGGRRNQQNKTRRKQAQQRKPTYHKPN